MNWGNRSKVFREMFKHGEYHKLWYLVKRRLYINLLMKPVGLPIGLIIIPIIYILKPIVRIRLSSVPTARIGHLTFESELYLRNKSLNHDKKQNLDIFFTTRAVQTKTIANKQLLHMYKRHMLIFDSYIASWFFYSIEWLLQYTDIIFELPHNENAESHALLKKVDSKLKLTEEEIEKGSEFLSSIGINPRTDWFVLVFSRDGSYLNKQFPNHNWGYHDWRNADINSFKQAVKYIIDQGGYVLRMGSVVDSKLDFVHEKYIDYAVKYRDDFLDVFLISTCKFMLGTTSGLGDVATVLDKPRIVTNSVPLGYVMQGRNCIYIPKKIINRKTNSYVSMKKILKETADSEFRGDKFLIGDCDYIDNTAEEICEVTEEMLSRLDGKYKKNSSDQLLLEQYYALFNENNKSYGIDTPIGEKYLRDNSKWIFG